MRNPGMSNYLQALMRRKMRYMEKQQPKMKLPKPGKQQSMPTNAMQALQQKLGQ